MFNIEKIPVQKNVLLAPFTTYKIGGLADYFVIVKNKFELVEMVKDARKKQLPYFVLGTGANVLFGDKGFRGIVIKNEAKEIDLDKERKMVTAESGALIEDIINLTSENDLSGFEHYAGIPSTVGGAMWQNLHFLSPERDRTVFIEEIVDFAYILDENNKERIIGKEYFQFGYDHSILHKKDAIVLEVNFRLKHGDRDVLKHYIQKNLRWRRLWHPSLRLYPSCGSVFKKVNGMNISAGKLIEQADLKGYQIGNIQVSLMHANFFVNLGKGKASEVRALIEHVQKVVKEKMGYILEPEIRFVGEF